MNALWLLILAAPPTLTHLYPAGAKQGTTATVTLGGTFERWPVRVWVEGVGVEATASKTKGQVTVAVAPDAPPGPRWFRVYDDQGASPPRRFIVGTLPEVEEQEPNDEKPQPINDNTLVNGRLSKSGDVDGYALALNKGQILTASLMAERWVGSPMDGVLQIVSERGFVLAQNNDHNRLDPQVVFTVPEDATYVVRVFAFPSMPDSTIGFSGNEKYIYRLTVTTGAFLDYAWPLAETRGTSKLLEVESDIGLVFAKGGAGFGFVRLEPHPCVTYDSSSPKRITPVTISGRLLKPGERHLHQIDGRKGQRLEAIIESASAGLALDPSLRLLDPTGKVLSRAQATALYRDTELAFTFPTDGVYRLEVTDARGEAGPQHAYRLRLLDGKPDFTLSVNADRFTLVAGKTVDIPVTVTRRNGHKDEINFGAEGLPMGVTAESTKTGLRLKADTKIVAGPFRIVGTTKTTKRTARTTLTDPEGPIEWLWLGVIAK